jgi:hypothetical protein
MKSKWKVSIEKVGETIEARIFEAVVIDGGKQYPFKVTVDKGYAREICGEDIQLVLLVQQSFMFLLEREPVTSILRDFNLREIEHYFPEYRDVMNELFLA